MKAVTIAVAGKGGTGKTTFSALLIRHLVKGGLTPVLAVDADPNTNLAEALGTTPEATIGGVLAEFLRERLKISQGMTKETYLEMKIEGALEETAAVDFLVMGRKQGDGCYCVPNSILKAYIEKLLPNYRFVVVDNEAGMEHLSRRTLPRVDFLFFVSDHSVKGLRACRRIRELVEELKLDTGRIFLVINRYGEENAATLAPLVDEVKAETVFRIPEDPDIVRADAVQQSFMDLPETTAAVKAVAGIFDATLGAPAGAGQG